MGSLAPKFSGAFLVHSSVEELQDQAVVGLVPAIETAVSPVGRDAVTDER